MMDGTDAFTGVRRLNYNHVVPNFLCWSYEDHVKIYNVMDIVI